jgi:hypothetical protein
MTVVIGLKLGVAPMLARRAAAGLAWYWIAMV